MQLRYLKTLHPPSEGISKVTALCWSPNNRRLAAVTMDRVVHLFDENGERRDRFPTKPADAKGSKSYLVVGMAFSPDSSRLCVAQSDNIVFVYKLGIEWGERKSICNKFHQTSSITCVTWPSQRPNEIVFGLAEGKVKVGQLRSNKPATLYSTESFVVSLCHNIEGNAVVSGHNDGSIYRFEFDENGGSLSPKLVQHSCVPQALAWGECLIVAGNDGRVVMYDREGMLLHQFDYTGDDMVKEFTCAVFNPSGESAVVGNFNSLYVYGINPRQGVWEEIGVKTVENMYSVTALSWKHDGSRLAVGNLTGAVDLYDACIRRYRYKGKFEFTYINLSQVIVKRLASGTRIVLKSHFGCEIEKINIYQDQFLIAHTPETLLMGDLESCKLSEVPWSGSGSERFFFDNPAVCMVFNAGELTLVEYGRNEILGSARTEHMSPHLISVRLTEATKYLPETNKKIAYLIDLQTIRILDLMTSITVATVNHDCKVDWLEMNGRATCLLFRDKRRQLHLYDLNTQTRSTLLNYCSYVQWVPNSDVVVAQNRSNLCVWYSIDAPERVTIFEIKGDVEDIERSKGRTDVIVDEGLNTVSYSLDESLIEFGAAMDTRDYRRAVAILEILDLSPESEAMWQTLANMAVSDKELLIAERCYSALGDVAKSRYVHKINRIAEEAASAGTEPADHYQVRAKLATLDKKFRLAEATLLEQGRTDEAIQMYQELHRWDEAIRVADETNHADAGRLRAGYYQWLLGSGQEDLAGQMKEKEGDIDAAINLYLQGGIPAKAAALAQNPQYPQNPEKLETIAAALSKAGLHDKAGEFFEKLNMGKRAMESYRRGHAYRKLLDLARRTAPADVVVLEEEWGDWLVSQKQVDAAINHYIEAGQYVKAVEAAFTSRQWQKAIQIVDTLDPEVGKPFYQRIAQHYEDQKLYEEAERYHIKAGQSQMAVEMYIKVCKWEHAHRVAVQSMTPSEVTMLYIMQAQKLEAKQQFKEAEKLYLLVQEPDLAINMYKKNRQYDNMIRLVTQHRKDLLVETHLHLAQQLETESQWKEAEHHYIEASDWKSAVNMYRQHILWEDAMRVAKLHGGINASKQVAYLWAVSIGGPEGGELLVKLGLVEQAIDYAMEIAAFPMAFQLATQCLKSKLPEVHLKHAMYLEDDGQFKEAELEFVQAGKPKEAIEMYCHQHNWMDAMRVAEDHDRSSISEVLLSQGRVAVEHKDLHAAEAIFLRAKKPEVAVKSYKEACMWNDALRVCKEYLPHKLNELNQEYITFVHHTNGAQKDLMAPARMWMDNGDYSRAIDEILKITQDETNDYDYLEEVYENAVKLAMNHVQDRIAEVVGVVAKRLEAIQRYEPAAELYMGIDAHKEAIDVYAAAGKWDQARRVAQSATEYVDYVEDLHRQQMGPSGDSLSVAASKGEWDKCLHVAKQQGPEAVEKYVSLHCTKLMQEGQLAKAVHVCYASATAPSAANLKLYQKIAKDVLGRSLRAPLPDIQAPGYDAVQELVELKELMRRIVVALKAAPDANPAIVNAFERLQRAIHCWHMHLACKAKEGPSMEELSIKNGIALLRYVDEFPADKAFYEAGIACKEFSWLNMAFVFLNRYIDLSEAMEEANNSAELENADFENTDIPFDFPLPTKQYLSDDQREEVRDWVLALSMDQQVEPSLMTRSCDKCGSDIYVATCKCPQCEAETSPCCVTGYPLVGNTTSCKSCGSSANTDDWNRYLVSENVCPWCGASESPNY